MAHEVFISYSSKNKTTADAVCHSLESAGIRCWIAPRDVTPGYDWDDEIVRGIDGSRVMVMVFSARSLQSKHVKGELHRAGENEIPIIPFRIEAVEPTGGLGLILTKVHWLDALTPPIEKHLGTLVEIVRKILGTLPQSSEKVVHESKPPVTPPTTGWSNAPRYVVFIGGLTLFVLALVFTVWQPWHTTTHINFQQTQAINGDLFQAANQGLASAQIQSGHNVHERCGHAQELR